MQLPRTIRQRQSGEPKVDRALQQYNEEVARVLNGNVSYGKPGNGGAGNGADNIAGAWGTVVDSGAANTDFTVTHNLGYIPTGYHVVKQSAATSVYTGSVAWTSTTITLRSSTAHVALTLFIF